ncbi:MAG: (2Fe-2S)-binding protein [Pseudonocardiales bacterium]|nr:MAG: (2Fe-2S)-binding protein [Pseudonocardiales bacterium]
MRPVRGWLVRLENAAALDAVVSPVQRVVRKVLAPGRVRDTLHGVDIGHPAHPILVQATIGSLASGTVCDLIGEDRAARRLIGLGLLSAVPAASAGIADWSEQHEQQMRTGLVHWGSNLVALSLYGASLVSRHRGRSTAARRLSLTGLAVLGASGFLGGDIAFRQAGGANHAEQVRHLVGPGWHTVGPVSDFPAGQASRRAVAGVGIVVVRGESGIDVLANECSHLSGPLCDGVLTSSGGDRCLVCPWHGSTFRLRDGAVVHGPATAAQPVFETRVREGSLQVRLPNAG